MNMPISTLFALLITTCICNAQSNQPMYVPAKDSPIAVGTHPTSIAVGDWNRDGYLDIVTANSGSQDLTILLGDGRGSFKSAPGSPIPVPWKTSGGPLDHVIAVGDINRDGISDLLVTDHNTYEVTVLLGDGKGHFTSAMDSPFITYQGQHPHTHGIALADVNNDGNPDVITSNNEDNSVSVLLGNGKAGFVEAPESPFSVGNHPYIPTTVDLNKDGNIDILTPNALGKSLTILLGNGKGEFVEAQSSPVAVGEPASYVAAGDVNGDNRIDLITNQGDEKRIKVLLADNRGVFHSGRTFSLSHTPLSILSTDLDRDGDIDLVIGHIQASYVSVLLGNGKGEFTNAPGSPYPAGHGSYRASYIVAVGDFNKDGKPDIVASNNDASNVTVLLAR